MLKFCKKTKLLAFSWLASEPRLDLNDFFNTYTD